MTASALQEAGVHRIILPTTLPVGPVNAYLVMGPPVTLVDCGPASDEAHEVLARGLAKHGIAPGDIERILITHGHIDHMGLMGRLVAESGARSFAHPHAVEQWNHPVPPEDRRSFHAAFLASCGVPESVAAEALEEWESYRPPEVQAHFDEAVEDGAEVGPFTAWHVPGHSPSDMALVLREHRIAFTGDHVLPRITPNPLVRRPRPGQPVVKALLEYQQSLLFTRDLDVAIACPGHGPPFEDLRAAVDDLLDRHRKRTGNVLDILLEHGTHTPYTVARLLLPRLTPRHTLLAVSAAVGSLEALEEEGRAASEHCDGVVYYAAVNR